MFLEKKINFFKLAIFIFCFLLLSSIAIIFFKSLKTDNVFIPNELVGKELPNFSAELLFDDKNIDSKNIFFKNKYYLINIWSSWCGPCRDEHPYLMKLSKNDKLEIIGINFKDKKKNAISFLNKNGDPYSNIVIDSNGLLSIDLGAYGVPETFLIDNNKIILLKVIGPLDNAKYKKITKIVNDKK